MLAIETHNLRKLYGNKVAVAGLSLHVKAGEVFGFLGPNGAGKTTSIKMLLGLVHPTSGLGKLLGQPIGSPQTRARVGFLPEHFRFHGWLTGREFLILHAELFGRSRRDADQLVVNLLERVGLSGQDGKRLRAYSKGMLQRIGLAQALVNHPEVVILDEPTSGLDPMGRRLVRDLVKDLSRGGTTVFINSHLLSEIEVTCDRVAFIREGEIVETLALNQLSDHVLVEVRTGPIAADVLTQLHQAWPQMTPSVDGMSVRLDGETHVPELNRALVAAGLDVFSLSPQRQSLEEKFVQIMGQGEDSV